MGNLVKAAVIMSIVLVLCVSASAQSTEKEQEAIKAANAWLECIDNGGYGKSWEESAGYFRNAVTREQWEQQLTAVRRPLGKLVNRKVISAKYAAGLPGAPDGEYVVIQYETSFENKGSSVETVTPMREENGEWRVSGYYIR